MLQKDVQRIENSVDPDQTVHLGAIDQGLHCVQWPISLKTLDCYSIGTFIYKCGKSPCFCEFGLTKISIQLDKFIFNFWGVQRFLVNF